ncbi:MAG: DNA-directed RNA polymerase subunit omega [Psychrilyobacter sp.]|nr:DNA-directed RNA polymerase subunit omega [Psychrilyobacter sp.]
MENKVTHDELLAKEPNKYKLAISIGKRYGQLIAGDAPMVPVKKTDTVIEVANKEFLADKFKLEKIEEEA